MMWSLFSRDPLKDFAYEIESDCVYSSPKTIWELHHGKKKGTGDPVSVFICVKENKLGLAKAAVKRFKTLRHPCILTYMDSLETDTSVYLVTERVSPLDGYLEACCLSDEQKMFTISWGLHQIAKGSGFLLNDCNLSHNHICLSSVFVRRAGEWCLAGLEHVSSATECSQSEQHRDPALTVYKPPESTGSTQKTRHKCSGDSWGLGCLLWEVFNGPLTDPANLKALGKIPKSLTASYCELVGARPELRPDPSQFLAQCRLGFMRNSFVDSLLFLEEIQVKESHAVSTFFASLAPLLDSFPVDTCKHKILPQMINAFEFGSAGSAILSPIFKLGKLLDNDEYQRRIVPCVVKLFSSKDRSTRAKLLQQMPEFVDHLQPALVNEQIFPQVAQGFLDTNPTIREQTVKCVVHLAPKLNYNNLNDEVMKHFARLQVKDEQGGIRTNTTVCLGKIAPYLHPQVRQKVLVSAFARAMRDPFAPARIAGVVALSSTQAYYSLQDSAKRVLPVLSPLTVDEDQNVREQAFKAVKGFLSKLEKVSEDPSLAEQMEAEVNSTTSGAPSSFVPSWAGWAVSSLAAKFYKSNIKSTPATNTTPVDATGNSALRISSPNASSSEGKNSGGAELNLSNTRWGNHAPTSWDKSGESHSDDWESESNAWGGVVNDWEDFDLQAQAEQTPNTACASINQQSSMSSDWDSNDWTEESSTFSCQQSDPGKEEEVIKRMLENRSQQQKELQENCPQSDSRSSREGKIDEEARKRLQEKRLQRQKELQEKRATRQAGPMKLGTRKKE